MRNFTFYIHTTLSVSPSLLCEVQSDEAGARFLARRVLAESVHRLLVEVREDDRLVFCLDRNGASWSRRDDGFPAAPGAADAGLNQDGRRCGAPDDRSRRG